MASLMLKVLLNSLTMIYLLRLSNISCEHSPSCDLPDKNTLVKWLEGCKHRCQVNSKHITFEKFLQWSTEQLCTMNTTWLTLVCPVQCALTSWTKWFSSQTRNIACICKWKNSSTPFNVHKLLLLSITSKLHFCVSAAFEYISSFSLPFESKTTWCRLLRC